MIIWISKEFLEITEHGFKNEDHSLMLVFRKMYKRIEDNRRSCQDTTFLGNSAFYFSL